MSINGVMTCPRSLMPGKGLDQWSHSTHNDAAEGGLTVN